MSDHQRDDSPAAPKGAAGDAISGRSGAAGAASLDIVALGEPMVEFNQLPGEEGRKWLQGFGGDTSNFVVAAARQGMRCGYVTRVGDDAFGRSLTALWQAEGIATDGVVVDRDAPTGVYFVTHGASGHAFSYLRRGSAASRLRADQIPREPIERSRCLHLSGISQAISTGACDAAFAAIELARSVGAVVSYDPNLRLALWPLARARAVARETMARADICCPSFDEAALLCGLDEPQAILDWLLAQGPRTVALKMGEAGAWIARPDSRELVAGHRVTVVDATGCGDCFDAAFASRLLAGDDAFAAGRYANAAAALQATGYGAVAPLPRAAEVRAFLAAASQT